MATISNITVCSGGNHIHGTITLADGRTRDFRVTLQEMREVVDDTDARAFIIRQVASIIRANPTDTLVQIRNRIQAATYME